MKQINDALVSKFNALMFMSRHREGMACAEERYTLWAMNHLRNPGSINAAFGLIESCLHNKEYEDAERYARHAMFMIAEMTDNFIPVDEQPKFLAEASYFLASSILQLVQSGGIPSEEKQKAGKEAITHARKALEIHTQLYEMNGTERSSVANSMDILANVLDYFNDEDYDEILRLKEQAIAIFSQMQGNASVNVAKGKNRLSVIYAKRAMRARIADDLNLCMANYHLALTQIIEAARIYRAIGRMDNADDCLRQVANIQEAIRLCELTRTEAATVG